MSALPTVKPIATQMLRDWQDGVNAGRPDVIAQLFAQNAIFIATAPTPLRGRSMVKAYYESVPVGLKADADLLDATEYQGIVVIVASVRFSVPASGDLIGRLSLTIIDGETGPKILLYHACLAPL